MRRVREILRLKHGGASDRQIARSLNLARSTVGLTLERVVAAGLHWPLPPSLTDRVLEAMLYSGGVRGPGGRRKPEPDWAYIHHELRRPGVTLMLLWEEYRQREPGGYSYSRSCDLYRDLGRPIVADDAAEPSRRRAAVRRLRRPDRRCDRRRQWRGPASADLCREIGCLQLHLCRGELDAERCLTGLARMCARSPSWAGCPPSSFPTIRRSGSIARTGTSRGSTVPISTWRPLPHRDPADARQEDARQGEGRGRPCWSSSAGSWHG